MSDAEVTKEAPKKPKRRKRPTAKKIGKISLETTNDILTHTTPKKPKTYGRGSKRPGAGDHLKYYAQFRGERLPKEIRRFINDLIARGKYEDHNEVVIALICFAHERGRRSGMGWFVQTLRRATKRWGL